MLTSEQDAIPQPLPPRQIPPKRRMSADKVFACAMFLGFSLYIQQAFLIQRVLTADLMGPNLFPLIVGFSGAVFSILLFFREKPEEKTSENKENNKETGYILQEIIALVPWFMALGYVYALWLLGFAAATVIYVIIATLWFGASRVWLAVVVGLLTAGTILITHRVLLNAMLPEGVVSRILGF